MLRTSDLVSSIASTALHAKARVNMTGDYLADASLDTQTLPLQPFLAVYAPEQAANVNGQTEIHAALHGPLKNLDQLQVQITIPVLKVGYGNTVQLAAASPIRARLKDGVIDLEPATISWNRHRPSTSRFDPDERTAADLAESPGSVGS